MSDQQERLIDDATGKVYEGKNYRVSSNTMGGAMRVEPIVDDAARVAAAADRVASLTG
jgi:ADP-ribosylglycohydrolase